MATALHEVVDNPDEERYEVVVDGRLAAAYYEIRGDEIVFLHTEVPAELEGQGIGSSLAKTALDDARSRGLSVVPLCPFISAYIQGHPHYLDIVQASHRARLEAKSTAS